MSNQETQITTTNPGFMQVNSVEEAMKVADIISKSGFCPNDMKGKPADIVIALQMGQELGLKPMQALQNIAVINGRPSLWGDAMLAVCRQASSFEYIKEEYMDGDNAYICRVKRRGEPEFIQKFSEADAKLARLWGKGGPWTMYPKRMLQMRARGFALRDAFPDLLRGIITQEEAQDMPRDRVDYSRIGETIEGKVVNTDCIDESQKAELITLINESGSTEAKICTHLKIETLDQMTIKQWQEVRMLLEKKVAKNRKSSELHVNQVLNSEPEIIEVEDD